jgi:ABC-type Mn2+/Zn2+ transport system ATPase subunit
VSGPLAVIVGPNGAGKTASRCLPPPRRNGTTRIESECRKCKRKGEMPKKVAKAKPQERNLRKD